VHRARTARTHAQEPAERVGARRGYRRSVMRGGNRGWTSCAEEAAIFSSRSRDSSRKRGIDPIYYVLLRTVAEMEDGPLQSAFEQLAECDLILVQGLPPDSNYRFKHALIQDAAYENLLKSRRTALHRCIAPLTLTRREPARAHLRACDSPTGAVRAYVHDPLVLFNLTYPAG
jgi:hypothetical protein